MRNLIFLFVTWIILACGQQPAPTTAQSQKERKNPFQGESLYVDPISQAAAAVHQATTDEERALLKKISEQPQADWIGEWSGLVQVALQRNLDAAQEENKLRVMIFYAIPHRDCGQYSKGGMEDQTKYQDWIKRAASAIGDRKAVVILEPDALGHLTMCLDEDDQAARLAMFRYAVETLGKNPNTSIYIDAGHPNWMEAEDAAERLEKAGITNATGFALNTSNYVDTAKNIAYGKEISTLLGGQIPFVIDTSRNGQGEAPDNAWCNPPGRGLGTAPTTNTGDPLVHAFLWLKRPGESDGSCNEGPPAGAWYKAQALELAKNAKL